MCHVIFGGKGITTHMVPKESVDKIKNLLISTTEKGTQDHTSLLAAYKLFDRHLTESNVKRPVVVLSDGHISRFNYGVLKFLQDNQIRLFLSPPDTTCKNIKLLWCSCSIVTMILEGSALIIYDADNTDRCWSNLYV